MRVYRFASIFTVMTLAACALHPAVEPLPQIGVVTPTIRSDPSGEFSTTISVMTYNVAGLPWPLRARTKAAMNRIGNALDSEFAEGRPDFLFLQEAFVPSAVSLGRRAGYANLVRGPSRSTRPTLKIGVDSPRNPPRKSMSERVGRLVNSGLALATDHSIVAKSVEPFGRRSCAGFDCLANKGLLLTRIDIPGVPEPLYLLNTHLNSRRASGAPVRRTLPAHNRQIAEMVALLERDWRSGGPLIYAGDFNTRNAPDRFEFKDARLPGELAHRYCHAHPDRCAVQASWDSDEPWMDTQDLQGYAAGIRVKIEPIKIEARFDAPVGGRMLSDHDALLVTYRLSWHID